MENHKLFKVNQNVIIRNKSGEILILQKDGKWMLPGGRLEDEGWLEGLKREVKEETGIEDFEMKEILSVDMSDSGETYIVTFLCYIESAPNINLSHEHQEYAWFKLEDIGKFIFWHEKIKERLRSLPWVMEIRVIKNPISRAELRVITRERFGDLAKAAVDIEQEIMAVGGELHIDEEVLLIEQENSKQENVWGINMYPDQSGDDFIEFDSMINIKPAFGNRSRSIDNPEIREKVITIVKKLVL